MDDPSLIKKNAKKYQRSGYSGNKIHAKIIGKKTSEGKPVLKIMGTGPRLLEDLPDAEQIYQNLQTKVLQIRADHIAKTGGDIHLITGMQTGFDEYFARVAVENNIPFTAVVPTRNFGSYYWGKKNRLKDFNKYLSKAENVLYAEDVFGELVFLGKKFALGEHSTPGPNFIIKTKSKATKYIHANRARNQIMIEMSDQAVAFDMGTPGTRDAIHRLKTYNKPIEIINRFSSIAPEAFSDEAVQSLLDYIDTTKTNPTDLPSSVVPEDLSRATGQIFEDLAESTSENSLIEAPSNIIDDLITKDIINDELVSSVSPINNIIDDTVKSVSGTSIEDIVQAAGTSAEQTIHNIKSADNIIADIGSEILKENKLKFGALGIAAVAGIGIVNRVRGERTFDKKQKQLNAVSNPMQNRSSMKTFSRTINSGHESLNVLRNKKRS